MYEVSGPMRAAVHAVILRMGPHGREVLMGLRQNTGYGDGLYCCPAGHIELGETVEGALWREMQEEIGVTRTHNRLSGQSMPLQPALIVEHLKDYGVGAERRFRHYTEYFIEPRLGPAVSPVNMEPDKCAELRYFPLHDLPQNTLPLTRFALEVMRRNPGVRFTSFGWDNPAYADNTKKQMGHCHE